MHKIYDLYREVDREPKVAINRLNKKISPLFEFKSEEEAIDALLLGRSYMLIGDVEPAEQVLNKALLYFEKTGLLAHEFFTHINLGVLYREAGIYDKALQQFNEAYAISYELDDFEYIIYALLNLGSIYCYLGKGEKSKTFLEEALNFIDKISNGKTAGDLYNNYAHSLIQENLNEDALAYLFKAYDAYKEYYKNEVHINWIIVLANIGEAYFRMGKIEEAETYLMSANTKAIEQSIYSIAAETSLLLSKTYEIRNDYKSALEFFKTYNECKETYQKLNKQKELEQLNSRFEQEAQKSKEEIHKLRNVALKNKTNELEKTLKNLSTITTIGQKLTASMDMDEIFNILRHSIYSLLDVHIFGLAVFDKPTKKIQYKYFEEMGKRLEPLEVGLFQGESLGSYCILKETDLYITDFYSVYEQYLPKKTYVPLNGHNSQKTHSIIYCRLLTEEGCVGLITVQHYEKNAYKESDFEVLKALASYVAIALSNAQKKNIINEKAKQLEFLSYCDPLTGLYNRRYFNLLTNRYCSQSGKPMGLIMGDMNHLKLVNDTYGHTVGDKYLQAVADVLVTCAQGHDVFRLGGDEFAILVYNAPIGEVQNIMAEIRKACDRYVFEYVPLSISLGYEYTMERQVDISHLFSKAESKMYDEKRVFHKKEM